MSTIQDTDLILVNRGGSTYKLPIVDMPEVLDTDLLLVNRDNASYKITGQDLKASFGSGSIYPGTNDISPDPAFEGGTGSEGDPFILTPQTSTPYGSTLQSVQTITIIGQAPDTPVIWRDNSVDAGTRFAQIDGLVTDATGTWTGKLEYADIPDSTSDVIYYGKLQIGLVHFSWDVTQMETQVTPPTINSVSIAEVDPEGARFTSQSFAGTTSITEGFPNSTKTFDAYVEGEEDLPGQFSAPLQTLSSSTFNFNQTFTGDASVNNTYQPQYAFDGNVASVSNFNWTVTIQSSGSGRVDIPTHENTTGKVLVWTSNDYGNPNINRRLYINGVEYAYDVPAQNNVMQQIVVDITPTTITNVGQGTAGGGFNPTMFGIDLNYDGSNPTPTVITDGQVTSTLGFAAGTDMTYLAAGDDVSQPSGSATGTVGSITDTSVTLSTDNGGWEADQNVVGPSKNAPTFVRKYLQFNNSGQVSTLLDIPQSPSYTTTSSNPSLTFTFPATFPDGNTPDDVLLDGTKLYFSVTAQNNDIVGPVTDWVQPVGPAPINPAVGLLTSYVGNTTGQTIITGSDLAAGSLLWVKSIDATYQNIVWDTPRTRNHTLWLDSRNTESDNTATPQNDLVSFNNNGFTLGADVQGANAAFAGNYIAWSWLMTAGFFDVVLYNTNGAASQTLPHNLGTKPGLMLVKSRNDSDNWYAYHQDVGATKRALFNGGYNANAEWMVDGSVWNDAEPTATHFTVGNNYGTNGWPSGEYVAYLWAGNTPGVIKCGTYTGTGSASSPVTVTTGFKPQFLMVRSVGQWGPWVVYDSLRSPDNPRNAVLYAGQSESSSINSNWNVDFTDTGFTVNASDFGVNYPGQMVYLAVAENTATGMTAQNYASQEDIFELYDLNAAIYQGQVAQTALAAATAHLNAHNNDY